MSDSPPADNDAQRNLLRAFRERMEREREAVGNTPTASLSLQEHYELLGRLKAFGDVVLWLYDVDTADIGQSTEILKRSNRLREDLLTLSAIYKDAGDFFETIVLQIPAEIQGSARDQFAMLMGFFQQTYAALEGLATAITPEQVEAAEKTLAVIKATHDNLKAQAASFPFLKGTIH